jgi:8-oxo-dGTP pyrophosphatase MutT (NUDIX family)
MSAYDPKHIPTKTLFLIGQKAIIQNKYGKILILQRSFKSSSGGKWSLPGGGLEDEDTRQGILREIQEETSLTVSELRPYAVRSYRNKSDNVVIIGYICVSLSEAVQLNWEHDSFQWVSREEALQLNITEDAQYFIQEFKQEP